MSSSSSTKAPSANWLALQKKLPVSTSSSTRARKRRKIEAKSESATASFISARSVFVETSFSRGEQRVAAKDDHGDDDKMRNGESIATLRKMTAGKLTYSVSQQQPGKYLALDCEMVGVGIDGKESSLARVSLVNYFGAVQMDIFVQQRERVVDYRTQYSGVRASDMVNARPFADVQKEVAALLKDRILVGHAVHNDLKALLLSHPRHQIRDTQHCAFKHKITRSRYPALRHLVQQELGVAIQEGEHSSVTDARATMAVFRLHRKEWEVLM